MGHFTYWFRLSPPRSFGLEDPGWTVLPAGEAYTSPVLDARTGNLVSPGTQSILRRLEHRVEQALDIEGGRLGIDDNVLSLEFDAGSSEEAERTAVDLLNSVLPALTLKLGVVVLATFIQALDEQGRRVKFLRGGALSRRWGYDIDALNDSLSQLPAVIRAAAADERIGRALVYFAKGLELEAIFFEEATHSRASPLHPYGIPTNPLGAEAFLNFWKVLETLLGEPTAAKFRARCIGELDLTEKFVDEEIRPQYGLRDEADVAHAERTIPTVGLGEIAKVKQLARTVLEAAVARRS